MYFPEGFGKYSFDLNLILNVCNHERASPINSKLLEVFIYYLNLTLGRLNFLISINPFEKINLEQIKHRKSIFRLFLYMKPKILLLNRNIKYNSSKNSQMQIFVPSYLVMSSLTYHYAYLHVHLILNRKTPRKLICVFCTDIRFHP